ncbi:hypothetical protein MGYG_00929 [Nannizzia gypsea CBS 118893]|uniref:Developmental regulatory protein wetA n=1 Tax=Arthroderma gypseum (strain ATCC MYA-4604 / CBS 118893) TaxID=535722 RepID=E5R2X1_ARTGP|nr:hypothetical protein MGYG_00929 [Nannizzia gypsea CBS 118893]EFQ97892.1 hypothetical protein MGYG_00929 [Nannizzia gypsea CBS 118893]
MTLPRHLGSRTQAEDKGYSLPDTIDDSFRNTLGLHGEMQPPSCTANKGPAFPYAIDGDTLFHAGLSSMKPGSLPVRRWTDDNLSSFHPGPALTPESLMHQQQHQLQQHDHAFDDHASELLLTAAVVAAAAGPEGGGGSSGGGEGGGQDLFNVDSGMLFQDPKGQLVERPSSRPTVGNWMNQQMYKYSHNQQPSATRRQSRQHKSNGQPATLTAINGDLLFSDHPALSSPPPSSSSSSPSPATQYNWFQQRLESFGLQQIVQSPECLDSTTTPMSHSQTPLDRRESLSHLSTVSGGSSHSPLNSSTPMSTPRYGPSIMSHPIHSSPVPVTNNISEASPCQKQHQQYQDPSTVASVASHTSPPPPHQILPSQPCDGSSASSWHPESMGVSVFHCSQPNLQSHEPEQWWTTTSNRNLQPPFPHAGYSSEMTSTSLPFRHQHQHQRFTHIPDSIQTSGLMIGMDTSSSEISSSIQQGPVPMSVSQLSGAEVAIPLAYSLPYVPQHHQRSHQHPPPIQTAHNTPVSLSRSAPTISAAPRSAPVICRRMAHGSTPQQSPKSRYHLPPQQRRAQHARKAASFSGQLSKCTKSTSSNGPTHNGVGNSSNSTNTNNNNNNTHGYNTVVNRAVKSVSFVNFTPEDSHKLLTGVAPSGSSKTKARREQEARDKRRKLSEAALLAVRRAGGDVEALEAVLC